jgi:Sec-independent protein translocase protein TatA
MILLPLAFWSPGPGEMLVIGIVALLLYGGELPRVAKSWGKTLAEFRRG